MFFLSTEESDRYLSRIRRRVFPLLFVKIPKMMWQEGQEEEDDMFDDLPESFVLCALHQGVSFAV